MNNKEITTRNKISNVNVVREVVLLIILVMEIVLFASFSRNFFTISNFLNVIRQVSITTISAVGMFMLILLGDIDLSVGSVYALIGVLSALAFQATNSFIVAVFVALALGTVIGFINGFITAKGKIPAFITTLAMMSAARGLAFIITKGTPIGVTDPKFTVLGSGYIFNIIPIPVVIMVITVAIGYFIIKYTRFGRYIYACGGNEQAARWSGINTDRIRILAFTVSGFLVGLSSIILAGRLGGGIPSTGQGAELDVIATVILGGTSLSGGKGKLWSVITAVFIIGVLSNGLTMLNISTYVQQVVKGIIIVVAVLLDRKASETT